MKRSRPSVLGLALLVATLAQAGCGSARRSRFALDAARLTRARELGAEQRAPDLFARAEQARRSAEHAPEGSPARSDYASEARLWLEAAIAEAARLELSEKRLNNERALLQAEQELTRAERERAEATRQVEAKLAAEIAREEARKALERASLAPRLRPKLSRAEVTKACEALLARATLVRAALGTFSLDAAKLAPLDAELAAVLATLARDPDAALDRAQTALQHTLALLGSLRSKTAGPTPADAQALSEALRDAGLTVTRGDRGLAGVLGGAFAERTLKPAARAVLGRVCSISRTFTHGAVRVAVAAKSSTLASARRQELQAELTRAGCDPARVGVDAVTTPDDDLEFAWLGY